MGEALRAAAETARRWLTERMLPLWLGAGFDARTGQFVEALTPAGEPVDAPRRTLVQARQMAVCAAAGRLGWAGPWAERATAAGAALLARGRRDDGAWIYAFGADGAPANRRSDLYTHAFVIFGFAVAGAALGRGDFVAAARETAAMLEAGWADPAGGFREGEVAPHPGRQNPHMHLLEAFLALHAATGADEDLARAAAVGALARARLIEPPGRMPEAFDDAWRPIAAHGYAPGHQFEWAWLLGELAARRGAPAPPEVGALADFGAAGVDAAGFTLDLVGAAGGEPATARLWPQTERLRTSLALGDEAAALAAWSALSAYADGLPGTWRDVREADGGWREGDAPASSAYHIVGALEALIRAAG